jgi:hypothetical protein
MCRPFGPYFRAWVKKNSFSTSLLLLLIPVLFAVVGYNEISAVP